MTLKVKLFSTTQNNISSLEDQVNGWIALNNDFNIKDIKVAFAEHNILMAILYEAFNEKVSSSSLPSASFQRSKDISNKQPVNFQEALNNFADKIERDVPRSNTNSVRSQSQSQSNVSSISGIEEVDPSSLKPGRLIQNNYNKYTKSNTKVSEEEAFNWD
ncbi:MAG: hypothetical protein ACK4IX_14650 [Candidatus Sericytochromatia bacterium]